MDLTKPSLIRLARCAGVKSLSDNCYDVIRKLVDDKMEEVIRVTMIVNSLKHTKTLMSEDLQEAISLLGTKLSDSNCIGKNTYNK